MVDLPGQRRKHCFAQVSAASLSGSFKHPSQPSDIRRRMPLARAMPVQQCGKSVNAGKVLRLQKTVHYKCVDQTKSRVIESVRDRPDNLETETSPKIDGALIAADHKIELHGEEAK